jgi:hypothetical protein
MQHFGHETQKGRKQLGLSPKWEDNIKMGLEEKG